VIVLVRSLVTLCAVACVALAGPARASDSENGAWLSAILTGHVDGDSEENRWRWWLDGQYRFQNSATNATTVLLRPAVGYVVQPGLSLWAGYGWFGSDADGVGRIDENRLWQDLLWRPAVDGPLRVILRTRLEQRWLDTGDDAGWRFRQMLRLELPFALNGKLAMIGTNEVLIAMNDTDWGERSGLDQNRLFLGLGYSPGPDMSFDFTYFNLYVDRPLVEDLVTDLLFAGVRFNF
jgi:hypothetical protein